MSKKVSSMRDCVRVVYFANSNESMHNLVRHKMPEYIDLVTLSTDSEEERAEKIEDADIVILAGANRISAHCLDRAKKLKLIVFFGVGYHDHVDIEDLASRGIRLAIAPTGTGIGVAEHAIMLMLSVGKRLPYLDKSMRNGEWLAQNLRAESISLYGKTIGVLGVGRIGTEVARRLKTWGVRVLCTDIRTLDSALLQELQCTQVSFEQLLAQSDILTLHVPLTKQTYHMIDKAAIGKMKPGAVLINCARGPIVEETALVDALTSGHISGAGLDVYEIEPPPHPTAFNDFRNVVLTPHNGPGTADIMKMKIEDIWKEVQGFLETGRLVNEIEYKSE